VIVGEFFDGDDDTEIARKQHDVYHHGLGILIEGCNRYARFARALLNDAGHEDWGQIRECDHLTLQGAHDLIAAAWRFRHDLRQGSLPLGGASTIVMPETLWLDWLRAELARWIDSPALVRSVQLILTNQNQPVGYAAESRLCLDILDRFPDVPWKATWRYAFEQDLAKDMAALTKPISASAPKPGGQMACECTANGRRPCNQIPCETTRARAARKGWGPLE
jgi:hypothetical protein